MTAQLTDTGEIDMGSVKDLKLPPPDTHCLDDEGVRPIDVWSYSPELVRQIVAADRAQKSARHREELLAYEVTINNLRARLEQAQPERKPMTESEMLEGRERTFSVDNPYCPCDRKTFMKVARYVEAFHGIFGGKP